MISKEIEIDDFNPLHHEGGDGILGHAKSTTTYFNPLHHEGGDPIWLSICFCLVLFQSTPPRGWRPLCNCFVLFGNNFNPLHHEGGD